MSSPFTEPSAPGGGVDYTELLGRLLLIDVHAVEPHIPTAFTEPGKLSPAIRADITVLDGPKAGDKYEDTLIFPRVLQSQLRNNVGTRVLGRLSQAAAKAGQNPAWQLNPATEADTATAVAFIEKARPLASAEPPF